MASVYYIVSDIDLFLDKSQNYSSDIEGESALRFCAARTIQADVRRFLIIRYVKKLNTSAITIQKWYRGWRGRVFYRNLLKQTVEQMYQDHYNKMASIIQKTWHGYLSRRDIFSYYALKAWIAKVQNKNNEVLTTIKTNEKALKEQRLMEFEVEARKWVVFILAKLHHLLRTKSSVGIYSKRFSTELSEFEKLLKSLKYQKYMTNLRKYYKKIVRKEKPLEKSGNYLPVIGHADLYWYLTDEDIETMIGVGRELKDNKIQKYYVNHPKHFKTTGRVKETLFVESIFAGKYEEQVRSIEILSNHELNISMTKFDNYINRKVTPPSTLNYIDYHVNVLLEKKCSIFLNEK